MKYKFHPNAVTQQEDIWLYTYETWGAKQADRYIDGLHEQLSKITDNSPVLRQLPENISPSVKFFRYVRHYVFIQFDHLANELLVLSILHDGTDIPPKVQALLSEIALVESCLF